MTAGISIFVPCYNEVKAIGDLLQAIYRQDHRREDLEVVIADGSSTDGTREAIEDFALRHPDLVLRLIDNPARTIPSGLNRAWREARGAVLIRLDAHSAPLPDYVSRCVEVLQTTGAANAGGQWEIRPSAPGAVARGIAQAGTHPLGAGDARYRTGGRAGPVDTVPFGAFPRTWLERVGGYDETLLTNEDYELNLRLRRAGGKVWFDPAIRSVYLARPTLGALFRQYLRYGAWKARMLRRYPTSVRWRQAMPPLFVMASVVLAALSFASATAATFLALLWGLYAVALAVSGVERAFRRGDPTLAWGVPLALVVIHMAWGVGFWWGLATSGRAVG